MGDFIQNNWFWILLVGLFIWMHASGMGCGGHGGHGSHGSGNNKNKEGNDAEDRH